MAFEHPPSDLAPPQLVDMASTFMVTRALTVAAELGVFDKVLDVFRMPLGGIERTEAEYADLLARAGFRLTRVVPTLSPMSVIEAVPV